MPPVLLPQLVRMQARIPPVFATPRADQLALAALELATALHAPQLRRRCASAGVDAFSVLPTPVRVASTQHARHHEFQPPFSLRFGRNAENGRSSLQRVQRLPLPGGNT